VKAGILEVCRNLDKTRGLSVMNLDMQKCVFVEGCVSFSAYEGIGYLICKAQWKAR
jgi:hypothetical protein